MSVLNKEKLDSFFIIASCFNKALGSVPILYGSLGLSKAIATDLKTDDIDLLVEDCIFSTRLSEIRALMEEMGFVLIVPKENKFQRGELEVGISHDVDMIEFSGVDPSALEVVELPAKYRVLNAQEYLKTYKASSLDGYRRVKASVKAAS
ncbi:hypothetical protein [Leucothrix arctica]|uniref:Nucleotidyltransferase family protein n=1 Tax=Leucothrix arctica TaxID=1481894 RepID=A0A317CAM7_9GAMM|nr:hypothetical protein [Leucothrix arctica]PWQ95674.1 hypothetical protein DKT75_11610 [Leucothrix arctica]